MFAAAKMGVDLTREDGVFGDVGLAAVLIEREEEEPGGADQDAEGGEVGGQFEEERGGAEGEEAGGCEMLESKWWLEEVHIQRDIAGSYAVSLSHLVVVLLGISKMSIDQQSNRLIPLSRID